MPARSVDLIAVGSATGVASVSRAEATHHVLDDTDYFGDLGMRFVDRLGD